MASVLRFRALLVSNFPIRLVHVGCLIRPYIFEVHLPNLRVLIILFKFKGRLWYGMILQFWTSVIIVLGDHPSSKRICHGDEEVGCGLAIGWDVTHVNEILPSKADRTKVDHPSFVDEANFIENIPKRLSSLVYRDDGGITNKICSDSQGTHKFKSRAGVETASGAVIGC